MAELDHWHPVLRSGELRRQPVRVTLCGQPIAVFRTESGAVGALDDRCPHRRMSLSTGRVDGERLVCSYHAWSYDRHGAGRSPGNPRLEVCARSFEAVERDGAIWLRRAGATTAFPRIDVLGYRLVCVLRHSVRAPLEVVLDNFTEVEHTPSTHAFLGYAPDRLADVEVRVDVTDDAVRVSNAGQQKPIPRALQRLLGIEPGDRFIDEWVTRFSPVHTVYEHWWACGRTGEPRPDRLREVVFFNPTNEHETELVTFVYTTAPRLGRWGLNLPLGWLVRGLGEVEIRLDRRMIERIADKSADLSGMKLGRFDRPLGANRKRIDRLYRGKTGKRAAFRSG